MLCIIILSLILSKVSNIFNSSNYLVVKVWQLYGHMKRFFRSHKYIGVIKNLKINKVSSDIRENYNNLK